MTSTLCFPNVLGRTGGPSTVTAPVPPRASASCTRTPLTLTRVPVRSVGPAAVEAEREAPPRSLAQRVVIRPALRPVGVEHLELPLVALLLFHPRVLGVRALVRAHGSCDDGEAQAQGEQERGERQDVPSTCSSHA